MSLKDILRLEAKLSEIRTDNKINVDLPSSCSDNIRMYCILVSYVITFSIFMAFCGEASCHFDHWGFCNSTGFSSTFASFLMGGFAFMAETSVVGALMLVSQLLSEVKYCIQKLQESLNVIVDEHEQNTNLVILPLQCNTTLNHARLIVSII